ncbi:DUF6461 domain-containing protein [Nonomuraea sediminis]|uniref:DUF6461 domain-containing protein n=1 Tax=Nonomuraea sediminis TaxID=2835864 RepID=UPI001BDDA519|nr:DUF6461 domain-containing protein [Nonomuraea sediminis]
MYDLAAIDYYLPLLRSSSVQWLSDRMWWISVTPNAHQSIKIDDIHEVLAGGTPPEVRQEDGYELPITLHCPIAAFFVHRSAGDGTISILNLSSESTSLRDYCRVLSSGASALGIEWGGKTWEAITYAEDGDIVASFPEGFSRELADGTNPEALSRELQFIHQFSEDSPAGVLAQKAAALAILEARSGLRITEEWLNSTHEVVYVDVPVSDSVHRGATASQPTIPNSSDVWPHSKKSALLFWIIDLLATKFGFEWPEISEARSAYGSGRVPEEALHAEVMDRTLRLGRDWLEATNEYESSAANSESKRLRWRAGIAIRVALREIEQGNPKLSSLQLAKEALGMEWPTVQQHILNL